SGGPRFEVVQPVEDAAARVDDVEAATLELERELVNVGLDERCRGCALGRDGDRLGGDVDTGDERAELDQLGCRLSGRALEMEDVLALDVREALADRERNAELPRHRVGAPAVDLVPGATIVLGG